MPLRWGDGCPTSHWSRPCESVWRRRTRRRICWRTCGWRSCRACCRNYGCAIPTCQLPPLLLLVDDLQWADEASLDLLRYLGHSWKEHGNRVLILGTVRSEELELNPQLSARLLNLERELPVTQVSLQPLSQAATLQLIEALAGDR